MFNKPKLLEVRGKIIDALRAEEARLSKLILERVAAERALVEGETAVTLGEQADANAARRKVDGAIAAINRQASKVAGLRSRLAGQAPELESSVREIKAALPAHVEGLKATFADEWARGVAAFGAIMGRRAAIEGYIGKLDLPEARPVACELPGAVTAPWRTIKSVVEALDEIAGWNRAAMMPAVDAMGNGAHHTFDPSVVYAITHSPAGAEVGALVMEPSFTPGWLCHLAQIGYAAPLASLDWQNATEAGAAAARRASADQERDREEQRQAQDPNRVVSYDLEKAREAGAANLRISNTVVPFHTGDRVVI